MEIEFDPTKNEINRLKHGIDLSLAVKFEFDQALVKEDDRRNYGETRYQAIGPLNGRLHVLIYTIRERVTRIISLRKANRNEERRYEDL